MPTKTNNAQEVLFTRGYITAALWSSTDDAGDPLDRKYKSEDIAPATAKKMLVDCLRFQQENAEDLEVYYERVSRDDEESPQAYAGHDFWLTRNGHGAGFWDRGLGRLGDRLSDKARACGTFDLYVGDDGRLHA